MTTDWMTDQIELLGMVESSKATDPVGDWQGCVRWYHRLVWMLSPGSGLTSERQTEVDRIHWRRRRRKRRRRRRTEFQIQFIVSQNDRRQDRHDGLCRKSKRKLADASSRMSHDVKFRYSVKTTRNPSHHRPHPTPTVGLPSQTLDCSVVFFLVFPINLLVWFVQLTKLASCRFMIAR